MSAYPSERQPPPPNPGSYNNHIVLEDLASSPWQDDIVPAPRLPQKKPRKERSDKGKHRKKSQKKPRKERSDKGKHRKKSRDMGKSGQDENEHPNGRKSVNPSAASQERKRRRRASLNREVLAPNVSVVIGAQDREGANGTPPKDQQTAVMAINHDPDHSPEIADHVTGVANISNAAADLPHDEPASQGGKKIPKEFGSFSPLSPTAIKEVRVFVFICAVM